MDLNDVNAVCLIGVALIAGLLILMLVMRNRSRAAARTKVTQARAAYDGALNKLKSDPNNPDLRQNALRLGRALAALSREAGAATVYDEAAIANDISAATAGGNKSS